MTENDCLWHISLKWLYFLQGNSSDNFIELFFAVGKENTFFSVCVSKSVFFPPTQCGGRKKWGEGGKSCCSPSLEKKELKREPFLSQTHLPQTSTSVSFLSSARLDFVALVALVPLTEDKKEKKSKTVRNELKKEDFIRGQKTDNGHKFDLIIWWRIERSIGQTQILLCDDILLAGWPNASSAGYPACTCGVDRWNRERHLKRWFRFSDTSLNRTKKKRPDKWC